MKGILKFDLPEEQREFEAAVRVEKYQLALWNIREYLRDQAKYGEPPDDVDKIYERFYEICEQCGVEVE